MLGVRLTLVGHWTLMSLAQLTPEWSYQEVINGTVEVFSGEILVETLRRAERKSLIRRPLDSSRIEPVHIKECPGLGRPHGRAVATLGQWPHANWNPVGTAQEVAALVAAGDISEESR
jgi:hypothetical protein